MNVFDQVIGNLPLLQLSRVKLARLSGQSLTDFYDQVRHNCIRLAWLQCATTGRPVRHALEFAAGRAHFRIAEVRGHDVYERLMDIGMQHAQRENELWTCFGFFLEGEIEHLIREEYAGPVLRSVLPRQTHALGTFCYAERLKRLLIDYRENIRTKALSHDTVRIIGRMTTLSPCLTHLPPSVAGYFELAGLLDKLDRNIPSGPTPNYTLPCQ